MKQIEKYKRFVLLSGLLLILLPTYSNATCTYFEQVYDRHVSDEYYFYTYTYNTGNGTISSTRDDNASGDIKSDCHLTMRTIGNDGIHTTVDYEHKPLHRSIDASDNFTDPADACAGTPCKDEEEEANSDCPDGWHWTDESNCEYACEDAPPCEEETNQANAECGSDNWEWTEQSTCEFDCICKDGDEYGLVEVQGMYPDDMCVDECEVGEVGNGLSIYNARSDVTILEAEGTGNKCPEGTPEPPPANCEDWEQACASVCKGADNVADDTCTEDDATCECKVQPPSENPTEGGENPEENDDSVDSGNTGDTGSDPENDPDPNNPENQPTDSPPDDPDDNQNGWGKATKENLDKIINQNNDRTKQLTDIKKNTATQIKQGNDRAKQLDNITKNTKSSAENAKKVADNQGKIKDAIGFNTEAVRQGLGEVQTTTTAGFENLKTSNQGSIEGMQGTISGQKATLADIVTAVKNQETVEINVNYPEEMEFDLTPLGTDEQMPTLTGTEFESELPTDNDYNEHNDFDALGTEAANTYIDNFVDQEEPLINAQITASGSPCLSGNVTIHNKNTPVSICFNKPWMLQGYAIMKIIFITIAYLQTAMLLNKALK